MKELICPHCGSKDIIYRKETGEYICTRCGWTSQSIDLKYYEPYKKTEEKPVKIPPTFRKKYKISDKHEETKRNIMLHIRRLAEHLPILDVDIRTAESILDRVIGKKKWKRKYLAIALVIISKKLNNTTYIPYEKYLNILGPRLTLQELRRTLKEVKRLSNIKLYRTSDEREILSKFYKEYGYDDNVAELINKIYKITRKTHIASGRKPATLYAAIAFISYKIYGYPITLRKTSKLANVTEVPIRNMIKEIMRKIQIEIDI